MTYAYATRTFRSHDAARSARFTRTVYDAKPAPTLPVSADVSTLAGRLAFAAMNLPAGKGRDAASDILSALQRRGSISEAQTRYGEDLFRKASAPAPTVQAHQRETVDLGNFAAMIALFDGATRPGKAAPKVSLSCDGGEIELSVSGPATKFPGTINVATPGGFGSNTWFGRIRRDGQYEVSPRATSSTSLRALLTAFAADPLGTMVAYGRLKGRCSVCRRKLVDPVSVQRGIGPHCAARFGF